MKKKKSPLQKTSRMMSLIILLAALPFGLMLLDKKISSKRNVASDKNISSASTEDKDLSEASPEEFKKSYKYQVLKDASVIQTSTGPGVRLGLFLMKNESGNKVFVCDQYPTVDLIFAAEGVAFSGEIPQMVLRSPCVVNADQEHIEALPIPFSQIIKSPLQQYEFKVDLPNSREQGRIYFRNVVEFWPTEWAWVGVKFYGKNPEDTLQINGYEVISVLGEPLVIKAPSVNE